jgi:hypothetical protein
VQHDRTQPANFRPDTRRDHRSCGHDGEITDS